MKWFIGVLVILAAAAVFLYLVPRNIVVEPQTGAANYSYNPTTTPNLPSLPEPEVVAPTSSLVAVLASTSSTGDLPAQPPLASPPVVVRGIYVTAWSAGYAPKINSLIGLIKRTNLNAVVIDIKDYSGNVSYKTGIADIAAARAENDIRILQPNALLKKLHDAGVYVVGRITVFQDPILAKAHPEWALQNKATGKTWLDNKGLAWMDPAAEGVWKYNFEIAEDALARGFDEINFDYVRFASDGDLTNIGYPYWDGKTARHTVIKNFFKYLRENFPGAKLSVDLFGLSTVNKDDLGIGQVIEDAYKYFDYVSPMVYPSHYASGFLGYANPAKYPYEVIKYSMDHALARLRTMTMTMTTATTTNNGDASSSSSLSLSVKLRPWLQDFDLGATYDATMVKKEMQAVYDSLLNSTGTTSNYYGGWLLWDPANIYTEGALNSQ